MKKLRQGFSLIELMIVLAIAGLIISLVFVAASAAQRNGRDTTRRADTQKLATAIEQWAANNNGALPPATDDMLVNELFNKGYLDQSKFKDPSTGSPYSMRARAGSADPYYGFTGLIYYVLDSPSTGKYTIITPLESGKYTYSP